MHDEFETILSKNGIKHNTSTQPQMYFSNEKNVYLQNFGIVQKWMPAVVQKLQDGHLIL